MGQRVGTRMSVGCGTIGTDGSKLRRDVVLLGVLGGGGGVKGGFSHDGLREHGYPDQVKRPGRQTGCVHKASGRLTPFDRAVHFRC